MSDKPTSFEQVQEGFKTRWPFGTVNSPGKSNPSPKPTIGSKAAINPADYQFAFDPTAGMWSAPALPGYKFKTSADVQRWMETTMSSASTLEKYQWSRKLSGGLFAPGMEGRMSSERIEAIGARGSKGGGRPKDTLESMLGMSSAPDPNVNPLLQ